MIHFWIPAKWNNKGADFSQQLIVGIFFYLFVIASWMPSQPDRWDIFSPIRGRIELPPTANCCLPDVYHKRDIHFFSTLGRRPVTTQWKCSFPPQVVYLQMEMQISTSEFILPAADDDQCWYSFVNCPLMGLFSSVVEFPHHSVCSATEGTAIFICTVKLKKKNLTSNQPKMDFTWSKWGHVINDVSSVTSAHSKKMTHPQKQQRGNKQSNSLSG